MKLDTLRTWTVEDPGDVELRVRIEGEEFRLTDRLTREGGTLYLQAESPPVNPIQTRKPLHGYDQ